jgi:hypothetical protein
MRENKSDYNKYDSKSRLYLPKGYKVERLKLSGPVVTLIVAAAPIIASVIAVLHEIGYTSNYGLPVEMIRPETATILISISQALFLMILVGLNYAIFLIVQYRKGWRPFVALFNAIVTSSVIYTSIVGNYVIYFPGLLTVVLLLFQLVPLIGIPANSPIRWKMHWSLPRLMVISVLLLVALGLLAYVSGLTAFNIQRTYLVPYSNPDAIVIRIYGDNIICATVDNHTVQRSFFILNSNNVTLTVKTYDYRLIVEK